MDLSRALHGEQLDAQPSAGVFACSFLQGFFASGFPSASLTVTMSRLCAHVVGISKQWQKLIVFDSISLYFQLLEG